MNTKKITALALAALMAAGTTSTAFADLADKDKALTFASKGILYGEDDGVIVKDADNEFNPGDTIYVQLKADKDATDKEIDRMKVYADWKVGGDHIESIDILYKKGETVSNGIVTGAKEYTVSIGGRELKISADEMAKGAKAAIKARILEEMKKDENFLKDERAAGISEVKTGFVIAGNYVDSGYTAKETGLVTEDGKWYTDLNGVKDAYFAKDGDNITNELFLPNGSQDKIQKGENASTNPNSGKYAQATKTEWNVSTTDDGAVWAVKKTNKDSLTEDDLAKANLAQAVTGKTIVKDTENTFEAQIGRAHV